MQYVMEFLWKNPEILEKLGFVSIEDLHSAPNYKKLPAVLGQDPFKTTIEPKTFVSAFSLNKTPRESTLDIIKEQFEIDLSYLDFKKKLKGEDSTFTKHLEAELDENNRAQEKLQNETQNPPLNDVPIVPNPPGSRKPRRLILVSGFVLIVIVIFLILHFANQPGSGKIVEQQKDASALSGSKNTADSGSATENGSDSCTLINPYKINIEGNSVLALRNKQLTDDEMLVANRYNGPDLFYAPETVIDTLYNDEKVDLVRQDGNSYYVSVCKNGKRISGYMSCRFNKKQTLQPIRTLYGRGQG